METKLEEFKRSLGDFLGEDTEEQSTPENPDYIRKSKLTREQNSKPNSSPEVHVTREIVKFPSHLWKFFLFSILLNVFFGYFTYLAIDFIQSPEYAVYKVRQKAETMTDAEKAKYLEISKGYDRKTERELMK